MTMTMTPPVSAASSATGTADGTDKDFTDFLGSILPGAAETVASDVGIDPRLAGQTVSQVLHLFGVGGPGKDFTPTVPQTQVRSQLQQLLSPYIVDQPFREALGVWLKAAIEPIQAQKTGKDYTPDLSKSWFSSIVHTISDAAKKVDWGQVAKIGMQAVPYVIAAA